MKIGKVLKVTGGVLLGVVLVLGLVVFLTTRLSPDPGELALGATAPKVDFVDTKGQPVSLEALRKDGLPVLVFYRGHW